MRDKFHNNFRCFRWTDTLGLILWVLSEPVASINIIWSNRFVDIVIQYIDDLSFCAGML